MRRLKYMIICILLLMLTACGKTTVVSGDDPGYKFEKADDKNSEDEDVNKIDISEE